MLLTMARFPHLPETTGIEEETEQLAFRTLAPADPCSGLPGRAAATFCLGGAAWTVARPRETHFCASFPPACGLQPKTTIMRHSIKSLPIPVAVARTNFSDVIAQARDGQRIKLTRHGKDVAWIVGAGDRQSLRTTQSKKRGKRRQPQ
jgi:prevent-host-death family protein